MFGRDAVPKTFKGDVVAVVVDGKTAKIDFSTLVSQKSFKINANLKSGIY